MRSLEGRVAIVTGAGHGLGRAHALYLAQRGARVVVNDLGGSVHGEGRDSGPANRVVEEIIASGGQAVACTLDVANWQHAHELVDVAVQHFGTLHVLVNNAGIVRDRALVNMSEEEWDAVVRVHLKGHTAATKFALSYWRECGKRGDRVQASVIHTSSVSGLAGIYGQANYASAKLGIVALSRIVSLEGKAYGVRSNVISPSARTRITSTVSGMTENAAALDGGFDAFDPSNVSPLVAWLAEAECPADSQIFHIGGNRVVCLKLTEVIYEAETDGPWTPETLEQAIGMRPVEPTAIEAILGRPQIGSS
jgi:NAD(P)-dependent dehydrogenase (short-subunit alcohol dehydrogenase family)